MMVIMGNQVTARYAFSYSLTWSEEVTRYMFIWSGFLSISFCIKKGASIKIEQFVGMLTPKLQTLISLVAYTIEIALFTYMIPFAYHYVMNAVESQQVSPAVGVPMYLMQSCTLIGFILADIRLVQKWVQRFLEVIGKKEIEVKGE